MNPFVYPLNHEKILIAGGCNGNYQTKLYQFDIEQREFSFLKDQEGKT
eukprot:CAMPEP_0116870290 /NCGR_PEP_ID=MMETSP0463-20121206/163_1 /TAXON_ID=181622 /ORGANISM="Strombidinopsis sp, Strain SopsisLIS2011" /LENGTH=47 /DNA_ID= /DNA_START= /DNA_END= /DNA_ORIENTATION=